MRLKRFWHRLKWLFSADFPGGSVAVLEGDPEDVIVIESDARAMTPETGELLVRHLAICGFKKTILVKKYDGNGLLRFTAIRKRTSAIRGVSVDDEHCNCGKPPTRHPPHPI